jgi:hypothetical protein
MLFNVIALSGKEKVEERFITTKQAMFFLHHHFEFVET